MTVFISDPNTHTGSGIDRRELLKKRWGNFSKSLDLSRFLVGPHTRQTLFRIIYLFFLWNTAAANDRPLHVLN